MLRFLYQALDSNKKKVSAFIDADSIVSARSMLEDAGLTNIKFFDDAAGARMRMKREPVPGLDPQIQADLEIKIRKRVGPVPALIAFAKNSRGFLAADILLLMYGLIAERWMVLALGGAVLIFMPVFFAYNYLPAYWYDQIQRRMSFGEWDRAIQLMGRLERRTKSEIVQFDLAVRRAQIAARRGRMEEGLAALQIWRDKANDPKGTFAGRLASVYLASGDVAGYVRNMFDAYTESSADRSRWIDYALALARFGDIAKAESLIVALDTRDLPEMHFAFLGWAQGLIYLRKGDNENAVTELANASRILLAFAAKPLTWATLALVNGTLSLAIARTGDQERARRFMQPLLPIFEVHADKSLSTLVHQEVLHAAG